MTLEPEVQILGEVSWPADGNSSGKPFPPRRAGPPEIRPRAEPSCAAGGRGCDPGRRALRRLHVLVSRPLLVRHQRRDVNGATTNERQIKSALEGVAGDMTTLHIEDGELRDAVARFPTVASVRASTSFPTGSRSPSPSACRSASSGSGDRRPRSRRTATCSPGTSFDAKALPRIDGASASGARLDGDAAAQAAILGATPAPLRRQGDRLDLGRPAGGVVVDLKNGPQVIFGDGSRAQDKWDGRRHGALHPSRLALLHRRQRSRTSRFRAAEPPGAGCDRPATRVHAVRGAPGAPIDDREATHPAPKT